MSNETPHTFPVLQTARLTLRQLAIHDKQEIFTLRSDSEINKYLDRQLSKTIDDAENFIDKIIKSDALYWAITLNDQNILIGTICLFGFSEENRTCEIGFELLTGFQGQGIMKEALEKVIAYAFNTISIKKIEAHLHRENLSSVRLLERHSFRNPNEPDQENPDLACYHLINSVDYPQ